MSKTAITSPELAPPVGPFSQAIEVGGFLYFSGQVGQDPATGKVVEGGIVAETERVFRNLSAVLKAAGRSFDHVARAGVYLTSMSDFVAMNGIYASISVSPFPPARRSRWPRCRLGPALRSTSSSRLEATHGG
jgi:2-iminobutanoate/2-iminopropanoate deaminase